MRRHEIVVEGWDRWDRQYLPLGCTFKQVVPPPMAEPDLADMELPAGWNQRRKLVVKPGGNTTHLPPLPTSLRFLIVTENRLVELPDLPDTLRELVVDKNELKKLPKLPNGFHFLDVKKNQLESLPKQFPSSIVSLGLTHNALSEIPSLANTQVESVGLGFNTISTLPAFPPTLRKLGCSNNKLTEIKGLPNHLHVLNCSNNCLRVLEIENLKWLHILVANNCCLKEIPLLPPMPGGDDGNDNNNNNNGNGPEEEDRRQYYFEGNPLTPEFAAIYNRYKQAQGAHAWEREPGSTRRFREDVLEEHRRLIAARKANASAIQQVFKGPGGPFGNYSPANLIAEFITGKKGTTEGQRLALLENEEHLGMIPKGAAEKARKKIANIALGRTEVTGPVTKEQVLLAKRARLYLKQENITAAEKRLKDKLEAIEIEETKKNYLLTYANLVLRVRLLFNNVHLDSITTEMELQATPVWTKEKQDAVEFIADKERDALQSAIPIDWGIGYVIPEVKKEEVLNDLEQLKEFMGSQEAALQRMVGKNLKIKLCSIFLTTKPFLDEDILKVAAFLPQWFDPSKTGPFLEEQTDLIDKMVQAERRYVLEGGDDGVFNTFVNLLKKFIDNLRPPSGPKNRGNSTAESELNAEDQAAVEAVEQEVLVVEDNDDEGEALPHAIAAVAAEAEEEAGAEAAEAVAVVLENNNNHPPAGGRRKHRTPRKHKGKRQTRKH